MLGKLWRALRRPPEGGGLPQADFVQPVDLPDDLDAPLRELAALGCEQAVVGDRAALDTLNRACERFPDQALPWALAGLLGERLGDTGAPAQMARARALDSAIAEERRTSQHFYARGRIAINRRDPATAARCLGLAHWLAPDQPLPLAMLGVVGYLTGDTRSGRNHYDRAIACAAPAARLLLRLNRLIDTIPQIYASSAHVEAERIWFERELDALEADPPTFENPLEGIRATCFYLCYQGRNDREVNRRLAALLMRACPALGYRAAHLDRPAGADRRRRIGIASAYLGRHSVGHWYRGFVLRLIESGRFDVFLFTDGGDLDPRLEHATRPAGRLVELPGDLMAARAMVEAARLDALVYTDVGMHPFFYLLAFSRLAPVQVLLVGHPCTSGIASLDYFASNVHQDAPDAQRHYSEQLVRLPLIPMLVEKTVPPANPIGRAGLGMAQDVRYYLCPMMLQKLHPDFDAAIAEILRRDPAGEFVLFADRDRPLWQELLEARFDRCMPDVAGRIVFRPFAPRDEFLSLLLAADCVVDPFHFSGGVTSDIALSLGVPVVTLAGELFRSRMTAGFYSQAGVEGCVAGTLQQFVTIALELAASPARRSQLGGALRASHDRLFGTVAAVEMFSDWLVKVTAGQNAAGPQEETGT
jgi:protein O-GlcNAc transferase